MVAVNLKLHAIPTFILVSRIVRNLSRSLCCQYLRLNYANAKNPYTRSNLWFSLFLQAKFVSCLLSLILDGMSLPFENKDWIN